MTPSALFLWALAREGGLDGFLVPAKDLEADVAQACAGGVKLACDPTAWRTPVGTFDLHAPGLSGLRCADDDPVACVILGWQAVRTPVGAWDTGLVEHAGFSDARPASAVAVADPPPPTDPLRARDGREWFRVACDAGLDRGCTELGETYRTGYGTYVSEREAAFYLRPACEHGEPEACRQLGLAGDAVAQRRAADLGHAQALFELSEREGDADGLARACAGGSAEACEATGEVDRACDLGRVEACVTSRLQAALARGASAAEAATEMDELCTRTDRACREAAFLRTGSPIVPHDGGSYPTPKEVDRWIYDLHDDLRTCQLAALHERPDASGWLDLGLRIGQDGRVVGVWTPHPFDEDLASCARDAFLKAKFRPPDPGEQGPATLTVTRRLPLFLAADAEVTSPTTGKSVGEDLARVDRGIEAHGDLLDECVVRNDDPRYVGKVSFDARVKRTGDLTRLSWASADVEPDARSCLEQVLRFPVPPPRLPIDVHVELSFFQPTDPPPDTHPLVAPPPSLHPLVLHTLVLTVTHAKIDGKDATAGQPSIDSVRAAHEEMARFVEEQTGGGVRLDQEFRTYDGPFDVGAVWTPSPVAEDATDEQKDAAAGQAPRFFVEPYEVPDELVASVEPLKWDAVFLWVPLPGALELPALGTTWTDDTLRGATFTAAALPSEGGVTAPAPAPAFELPLHELWHQLAARADHELGVTVPDNHERLVVEGRTLNPRIWNSGQPGASWYEAAFGKVVHPEVWADLGRMSRVDLVQPGDLAIGAECLHDGGARHCELVQDGHRSLGTFRDGSTLDPQRPSDDAGWWGVGWERPRSFGRVVARLAPGPEDAPTVRKVAIEGRDGNTWEPLGDPVVVDSATVDVQVDPSESWDGVRVRVLEREGTTEPLCAELEVYGH